MRKSAKLITALSVAGLAVVAGSAFTGAGLTTTGQAADAQFIGGTVAQSVTGGVLEGLEYSFASDETGSRTKVNSVKLTFDAASNGKAASIVLTDGDGDTFSQTCGPVTLNVATCAFATPVDDVANADVTIASTNNTMTAPVTTP